MTTVTTTLRYNLSGSTGVVGQNLYKQKARFGTMSNWRYVDKLNKLTTFKLSVPNDEFGRANSVIERKLYVPLLNPYSGFITSKTLNDSTITLNSKEFATHFERRINTNDGQKRVTYTDKDWFNVLWLHRNRFTIKKTHVAGDTKDIPILLNLGANLSFHRHAQLNGDDFVVTDEDGITQIPHEIETYNPSTGALVLWLKLPKLSDNSNTSFYVYYDNPAASNQEDIVNVWKDCYTQDEGTSEINFDYNAVYHLSGDSVDSTENNNDGTDTNIVYVGGKIGTAAQFDALTSEIDAGSDSSVDHIFRGNVRGTETFNGRSELVGISFADLALARVIGMIPGSKINKVQVDSRETGDNFRLKLYDNVDGRPLNLLTETDSIANPGSGIHTFTYNDTVTVPDNGMLWVGLEHDNSGGAKDFGGTASSELHGHALEETHTYGVGPDILTSLGPPGNSATFWCKLIEQTQVGGGWISAWVNPKSDGESNNGRIIDKSAGAGPVTGWSLFVGGGSGGFTNIAFSIDFTSANMTTATDTAVVPYDKWSKIDIVYNQTDYNNIPKVFLNGVETPHTLSSTPTANDPIDDSAQVLTLGNLPATTHTWDGEIEEARLMNVVPPNVDDIILTNYNLENDPTGCIVKHPHEEFKSPADKIAQDIIDSANEDMPIINSITISDLVSLHRLDNNVLDSSGNGHDVTFINGTEEYEDGYFANDKSHAFNGSNQRLDVNTGLVMDNGTTWCISAWVKKPAGEMTLPVVYSEEDDSFATSTKLMYWGEEYLTSGKVSLRIFQRDDSAVANSIESNSGIALGDTNWHHILLNQTSGTTYDAWVDGIKNATETVSLGGTYDQDVGRIGARAGTASQHYTGNIDNVRRYSRSLTDDEIIALSKETQSGVDIIQERQHWKLGAGLSTEISNLVALYKFDEDILDSKGASNLTKQSGIEQYVNAKYNKGLHLDDTTYYSVEGDNTPFDFDADDAFSYSMWIIARPGTSSNVILSKRQASTAGYNMFFSGSGTACDVILQDTGANRYRVRTQTSWRDGELHHIVFTYDGSDTIDGLKIYIDGISDSLTTITNTGPLGVMLSGFDMTIGCDNGCGTGNNLAGMIDDLRFYNKELSDKEVKILFNSTNSGLDILRTDFIPTDIINIGFNFKNHWEALNELSLTVGKDLFFDNRQRKVFIQTKGKTLTEKLNIVITSNPETSIENFANEINLLGKKDEFGTQIECDEVVDTVLRFNYEKVVSDGQINTDKHLNSIASNMIKEFQELTPQIKGEIPIHQFHRLALQSGDVIPINQPNKNVVGNFRIMDITVTPSKARVSLEKAKTGIIRLRSNSFSDTIEGIIGRIKDGDISS